MIDTFKVAAETKLPPDKNLSKYRSQNDGHIQGADDKLGQFLGQVIK